MTKTRGESSSFPCKYSHKEMLGRNQSLVFGRLESCCNFSVNARKIPEIGRDIKLWTVRLEIGTGKKAISKNCLSVNLLLFGSKETALRFRDALLKKTLVRDGYFTDVTPRLCFIRYNSARTMIVHAQNAKMKLMGKFWRSIKLYYWIEYFPLKLKFQWKITCSLFWHNSCNFTQIF